METACDPDPQSSTDNPDDNKYLTPTSLPDPEHSALRLTKQRLLEIDQEARPPSPISQSLRSLLVGQHRAQLRTSFIDIYFPANSGSDFQYYFEYALLGWSNDLCLLAFDAFQLLHLGTVSSDQKLIRQSQVVYGRALRRLSLEMNRLSTCKRNPSDELIAAIFTCAIYERNSSKSFDSPGWQEHTRGFLAVLKAYGADVFSNLGCAFWMKMWQSSLLGYGLLNESALFLESPEWQIPQQQNDRLFNTSIKLSGRLEQLKKAANHSASADEVSNAITEATELRESMHKRIFDWSLQSGPAPPYVVVDLDRFSQFKAILKNLAELEPSCFLFQGFFSAVTHTTHWLCLMLLNQALLDVFVAHPDALGNSPEEEVFVLAVKRELQMSVSSLCKSIAYFSDPSLAAFGTAEAMRHLFFLERHYARYGDKAHVAWCRKIKVCFGPGHKVAAILKES
jgi:hypothetical protein